MNGTHEDGDADDGGEDEEEKERRRHGERDGYHMAEAVHDVLGHNRCARRRGRWLVHGGQEMGHLCCDLY